MNAGAGIAGAAGGVAYGDAGAMAAAAWGVPNVRAIGAGGCDEQGMPGTAARAGAEVYLTGEMKHHDRLGARDAGLTLVPQQEPLKRDDVIVTPHNAFNSQEALERILDTTAENIAAFAAGTAKNVVR